MWSHGDLKLVLTLNICLHAPCDLQLMELLTIDPNNESYLKLQTDLNDAIRLTKDLISTHKSKESSGPSGGTTMTAPVSVVATFIVLIRAMTRQESADLRPHLLSVVHRYAPKER